MVSLADVVDRVRGRRRADRLRARVDRFRHLLEMDNRVLSLIGDANETLAGEYLFDTQYLRWLEEELRAQDRGPAHAGGPDGPDFTPERCGTYHDIVRFAHERGLDELSHIGTARLHPRGRSVCRLNLEVPLDLCVVDIGGGVAAGPPSGSIGPERITSKPLALLIEGLLTPGVWATSPADMDLDGFMASATRGVALTSPASVAVTRNVAIVSGDYLNLNLKAVKDRKLATHVIIITGFRTYEDARGAEYMGAYGFIDKPFHLEELRDMVRSAARRPPK